MQEKKRKCQICGAEYKACNSCDKFRNWMSVVDSQKCYLVYLAVTERRLDITDDAGCVAALAKAGINRNNLEQKNIVEPVKEFIRDVFNRSRKVTQQPFVAHDKIAGSKVSAEAEAEDK